MNLQDYTRLKSQCNPGTKRKVYISNSTYQPHHGIYDEADIPDIKGEWANIKRWYKVIHYGAYQEDTEQNGKVIEEASVSYYYIYVSLWLGSLVIAKCPGKQAFVTKDGIRYQYGKSS